MSKKMAMWIVLGWALAFLLPPQQVVAMFRGKR